MSDGARLTKSQWSLQAKISLVLILVILPTFLIVTIAQNHLAYPVLEEEIRQGGIHYGKSLAAEIVSSQWLFLSNPSPPVENAIQEMIYLKPDIIRMDVVAWTHSNSKPILIGSNIDEENSSLPQDFELVSTITTRLKKLEKGLRAWEIYVPIESRIKDLRGQKKNLGLIRVIVSTQLVGRVVVTLWKTTATAAAISVIILIIVLSYFLKKTIIHDRILRKAKSKNLYLTEQLQEAQRQLMINEKFAVMGQLTASFAHEIGTPLNTIGGHLQILKEEIKPHFEIIFKNPEKNDINRFDILNGQLKKIESIVKGFLQSTSQPNSSKQLVDINHVVNRALGIINPRIHSLEIHIKKKLDLQIPLVRIVPLDLEQVLINLFNNSIDSLKLKKQFDDKKKLQIEVITEFISIQENQFAQLSVYDTGLGISKNNLINVTKPFFTTKNPGEGTGLGLPICQQLIYKYEGDFIIDSKEGAWTKATIKIPVQI